MTHVATGSCMNLGCGHSRFSNVSRQFRSHMVIGIEARRRRRRRRRGMELGGNGVVVRRKAPIFVYSRTIGAALGVSRFH